MAELRESGCEEGRHGRDKKHFEYTDGKRAIGESCSEPAIMDQSVANAILYLMTPSGSMVTQSRS